MARRARFDAKRHRLAGGTAPVPARRAPMGILPVVGLAVGLLLGPASLSAQHTSSGRASVRVATVSQLDVAAVDGQSGASGLSVQRTGTLRVRVRTNHRWRLVLAARTGAGATFTVRAVGPGGSSAPVALVPGREHAVASGGRGEEVVELEVTWDGSAYSEVSALPLTYTLASVDG